MSDERRAEVEAPPPWLVRAVASYNTLGFTGIYMGWYWKDSKPVKRAEAVGR